MRNTYGTVRHNEPLSVCRSAPQACSIDLDRFTSELFCFLQLFINGKFVDARDGKVSERVSRALAERSLCDSTMAKAFSARTS